jgi:DNA-binding NarL/FixJ family response regulator
VSDVVVDRDVGVVGRDPERAALRDFLDADEPSRALLLVGGPGAGKTTLWDLGVAGARERGLRVLVARPSGAEAEHSFTALIDLFDGIEPRVLAGLPAPQLAALEVALLRVEPAAVPPEPHAIGLGLLNGLRALAACEPLLIAIDDLQWLDPPSADALVFVARRLRGERVRFLLARRPGRRTTLEQAVERQSLQRLEVGPLSVGATRQLLSGRLGLTLSRQLLRRIVDSTLGNPLFVLELGRLLMEHGLPPVGEDMPVPDSVEDVLGTRVAALPEGVSRLLLAVALSADLGIAELVAIQGSAAVEDALDGGLLVVDGERVRASHPLLAGVARKRSRARERRELHRALAEVVNDPELHALHLALASAHPDAALAATVDAAATGAGARGARLQAVRLAEHALRLTPRGSAVRYERLLALAEHLERAGEAQRVTDLLTPEVASLPGGTVRARGRLLLSEGAGPRSLDDLDHHLELALADCRDDPDLRSQVLARKAANAAAGAVSRLAEAEVWALEALAAADGAGSDVERFALYALSWPRALRGRSIDDLCERSQAASDPSSYIVGSPERVAGQRRLWRGELNQARSLLTRLLALADERGEAASYALLRLHVCELELRAGEWESASRLLDEWAESSDREMRFRPQYERCRALLAAGRGLSADARQWATDAIALAEAAGCRWDQLEALRARGIAALQEHEPEPAVESLRAVWQHTEREGITDPGVFPVAPELVEALVEVGELDEALAVTARLRELAEQQQHPWGLATAKRCAALVQLGSDISNGDASAALDQAAGDYGRLGLHFDQARALLTLGRAQRRLRQWGAARSFMQEALSAFETLGSPGWAGEARAELDRVGARRPRPSGELTPSERRVAELAASGRSNKQIAHELHVTVHTVEAHLSHGYAKLGVHSRGQLAARLSP